MVKSDQLSAYEIYHVDDDASSGLNKDRDIEEEENGIGSRIIRRVSEKRGGEREESRQRQTGW